VVESVHGGPEGIHELVIVAGAARVNEGSNLAAVAHLAVLGGSLAAALDAVLGLFGGDHGPATRAQSVGVKVLALNIVASLLNGTVRDVILGLISLSGATPVVVVVGVFGGESPDEHA
jgi:hypothetical protein